MSVTSPKIICLLGPTATGKTDLAIALAQQLPIEIISVDSAMVYRGMDIGTGKPNKKILTTVPHHLIDIRNPSEVYSAADFRADALKAINSILHKNKIPLLVGGTMLYFKALLMGLADLPTADKELREQLAQQVNEKGLIAMHQQLIEIDPVAANRIHPNDPQRLLRALEVYYLTGVNLSTHIATAMQQTFPYPVMQLALTVNNRALLHERIAKRFQNMLAQGLVTEVEKLHACDDLHENLPALRSVGYRQVWQYLEHKLTYDQMVERAIIATRQLAKRQLTWLRSWPGLIEFDFMTENLIDKIFAVIRS
jgi:tRNA dimethylallyltransferase